MFDANHGFGHFGEEVSFSWRENCLGGGFVYWRKSARYRLFGRATLRPRKRMRGILFSWHQVYSNGEKWFNLGVFPVRAGL